MKYSHDYSKLKLSKYTTIRRYKKGNLNDIITENFPSGCHKAQIIKIERRALADIYWTELIFDTDCDSREEAYALFQSFYKKPIDFQNELFYIYYLRVIQNLERD